MTSPTRRGLTPLQVQESRARHGANVVTPPPKSPWWREYLSKFNDPVIRILMVAAVLAIGVGAVDGHVAEGVGIVLAILLATFLAFWNESRANRAFDVLNTSSDDTPVKVLRDANYTAVPRRDVVVGDLVVVEVGEEVPADGTLFDAVGLLVNEAKLTGESNPVNQAAGERLLRGTTVVDGYGTFEVAAVGDGTEIGTTLREATEDSGDVSPLNRQLAALSKVIGIVGFGVALLVFFALAGRGVVTGDLKLSAAEWYFAAAVFAALNVALVKIWLPTVEDAAEMVGWQLPPTAWLHGGTKPWLYTLGGGAVAFAGLLAAFVAGGLIPAAPAEWLSVDAGRIFLRNFMIAVTIIVVAVPEGLAMSVTLSLAYSMRKMTAQHTLVRRMQACETIGAATVICSDKTGTLTQNEMRVAFGRFGGESTDPPADPALRPLMVEAVAANTTAQLNRDPNDPVKATGNPTEVALLLWLDAVGEDYAKPRKTFAVATQWTFNTERKFMATAGRSAVLGGPVLYVKGAPEVVLARCDREATAGGVKPLSAGDREVILTQLQADQGRGMRTLGFAYKPAAADIDGSAWIWSGSVAVADPIRAEVPAAVAACRAAGIGVKIVTGDTPDTAREIARQGGLDPAGVEMTGPAFAALSDADAAAIADKLSILARARPADKLRLVSLLKKAGHVVAVTGDGVNDGPALNYADVGLAMGKTGSAVAREASDIVLLDDSFASIVSAVRWGRGLYENIQRFILFQLTINVCALGLAVLGPFVGFELPLTVMQMLWVNLIMDTFAALALATEPPHASVLTRKPRKADAFIVTPYMAKVVFGVGGAFLAVLLGLIVVLDGRGELPDVPEPTWGGTVLFTVFVLLQFWNLFNAKMMGRPGSVFRGLAGNPSFLAIAGAILIGQILIVQFGGTVFRTVPLSAKEWGTILAGTFPVLLLGEAWRAYSRNRPGGTG